MNGNENYSEQAIKPLSVSFEFLDCFRRNSVPNKLGCNSTRVKVLPRFHAQFFAPCAIALSRSVLNATHSTSVYRRRRQISLWFLVQSQLMVQRFCLFYFRTKTLTPDLNLAITKLAWKHAAFNFGTLIFDFETGDPKTPRSSVIEITTRALCIFLEPINAPLRPFRGWKFA